MRHVLVHHQFSSHHSGIVDAPPTVVWSALQRMHWTDLRATQPLLWARESAPGVLGDCVVETSPSALGRSFRMMSRLACCW